MSKFINFNDIIGSDADSESEDMRGTFLGSTSQNASIPVKLPKPKFMCYIEVTMNYPRTPTFLKLNSIRQKELYKRLWFNTKNIPKICIKSEMVFEYCKSGQVHLHGYVILDHSEAFHILGLISDYVKNYLSLLPNKYDKFNEASMFEKYERYRCPSICVQYKEGLDSLVLWEKYMEKCQLPT